MCGPKPPPAPNPKEVAGAQTAQNVGTAVANTYLNNYNQVTPDGSLTWSTTGNHAWTDPNTGQVHNIPTQTATQTLSPQQQAIKDQSDAAQLNMATTANQQSKRIGEHLNTPFNLDNAPKAGDAANIKLQNELMRLGAGPQLKTSYDTDFTRERDKTEEAIIARNAPRAEADRKAMEQRLADQGAMMGSEQWNYGAADFARAQNDFRLGATLASGQEQSRLADLARTSAAFSNDANQQMWSNEATRAGFNNNAELQNLNVAQAQFDAANQQRNMYNQEQFAMRNQPINEISALLGGSQVDQPNWINTKQNNIATTDYAGIVQGIYNQQSQNWQNQANNQQKLIGGIIDAGGKVVGGAIGASDERLKKDVKSTGQKDAHGIPVKSFRFKQAGPNSPKRKGMMAQDVEKKRPDAVFRMGNGLKGVNYGKLMQLGGGL